MFNRNQQAISLSEPSVFTGAFEWFRIILLVVVTVFLSYWGYIKINDPLTLPITKVRALGDFSFVTEDMLHKAMSTNSEKISGGTTINIFENKGFFNIDVDAIKLRVEKMPWVKQASVQRVWPDTLIIEVVEHTAIAYWGDKGLVNNKGKVFYPDKNNFPKDLPRFIATEGLAKNCVRYFKDASEMFRVINLQVVKVQFNARQALTLTLDNGVEISLGRQNKLYRLQRFTQVYSTLRERVSLIERIDMRYTNGFTVKWKQRQANGELYNKVMSDRTNV